MGDADQGELGKLALNRPLQQVVAEQQEHNQLEILPVGAIHVFGLQALPAYHRDPFDRLLIAQAITEGMPILSVDTVFQQYPVQILAN